MKKILLSLVILTGALFASCEKEEIGGTATQSLAGDWVCTVYLGSVTDEGTDWTAIYGLDLLTYNTSANVSNELWLNDSKSFWGTLCKVNCNAGALTFGVKDSIYTDLYYEVGQKIWGGKVTPKGAVGPTGAKVDKIEYYIQFEDDQDDNGDPDPFGTTYYVVGYRRTGFDQGNADDYKDDWDLPE